MFYTKDGYAQSPNDKVRELTAERDAALAESKEWKTKFKDLNRALMCELRDPNGTIWEHARNLQSQLDNAVLALGSTLDPEQIKKLINKKSERGRKPFDAIQNVFTKQR
jgi:hypothetical protein